LFSHRYHHHHHHHRNLLPLFLPIQYLDQWSRLLQLQFRFQLQLQPIRMMKWMT
jgi:hypothetical protein